MYATDSIAHTQCVSLQWEGSGTYWSGCIRVVCNKAVDIHKSAETVIENLVRLMENCFLGLLYHDKPALAKTVTLEFPLQNRLTLQDRGDVYIFLH